MSCVVVIAETLVESVVSYNFGSFFQHDFGVFSPQDIQISHQPVVGSSNVDLSLAVWRPSLKPTALPRHVTCPRCAEVPTRCTGAVSNSLAASLLNVVDMGLFVLPGSTWCTWIWCTSCPAVLCRSRQAGSVSQEVLSKVQVALAAGLRLRATSFRRSGGIQPITEIQRVSWIQNCGRYHAN